MSGTVAQLTYTSFDPGDSRAAGWQVKEMVGQIDQSLESGLVGGVSARLPGGNRLSPYLSDKEVAALPRRLVFDRANGGLALWHTAHAGPDEGQRLGNVFAHVVYYPDGQTLHQAVERPIDLWRSPGWLVPYGRPEVEKAAITSVEGPQPGDSIGLQTVLKLISERSGHQPAKLLAVLADAVVAGVEGGAQVVLATANSDSAARWIGAVTHLLPWRYAVRTSFSTLDGFGLSGAGSRSGTIFSCVSPDDSTDRDRARLSEESAAAFFDEGDEIELGTPGQSPHQTSGGQKVAATELAEIVLDILVDPAVAERILHAAHALDWGDRHQADQASSLENAPAWAELEMARSQVLGIRRRPGGPAHAASQPDLTHGVDSSSQAAQTESVTPELPTDSSTLTNEPLPSTDYESASASIKAVVERGDLPWWLSADRCREDRDASVNQIMDCYFAEVRALGGQPTLVDRNLAAAGQAACLIGALTESSPVATANVTAIFPDGRVLGTESISDLIERTVTMALTTKQVMLGYLAGSGLVPGSYRMPAALAPVSRIMVETPAGQQRLFERVAQRSAAARPASQSLPLAREVLSGLELEVSSGTAWGQSTAMSDDEWANLDEYLAALESENSAQPRHGRLWRLAQVFRRSERLPQAQHQQPRR